MVLINNMNKQLGDAELVAGIQRLKQEKDIVVLAHFYVQDEIQDVADYIGDSYQLAKLAKTTPQQTICFCGVNFMGESAKILSPGKRVIMPDIKAGCPMADMISTDEIERVRALYDDLAVVAYVNTTAETKAHSDVCVTSSNCLEIVRSLPQQNIYFIPDINLGSYIKSEVPEKNVILHDGFCCVHHKIRLAAVQEMIEAHPDYKVLVHPEAQAEVVARGDVVGSTKVLLDEVKKDDAPGYIVCTEVGILHQMKKAAPGKEFLVPTRTQTCRSMKRNTLQKLYDAMDTMTPEIKMDEELMKQALRPLEKMMELSVNLVR